MSEPTAPEIERLSRFFNQLHPESDRGAALIARAMIEDSLGEILVAFLADTKAKSKLMKGPTAPFGTLSARISVCLALGLIGEDEYHEMEIIRDIGNKFAHNWDGFSFNDSEVERLCAKLPWRGPEEYRAGANPKDVFCTAVSMLMVDLMWRVRLVRKEKRQVKPWPNRSR